VNGCCAFQEEPEVCGLVDKALRLRMFASSNREDVQSKDSGIAVHGREAPFAQKGGTRVTPFTRG